MANAGLNIGDVINTYMKLRTKKEGIEAQVKEQVKDIKAKMDKLEAYLKASMDEQGLTSFKSEHGTAFLSTTDYANVADWDEVLSYIKENDAYDLLEKRVTKLAVREYIKENKQVPPGITYGTKIEVSIRKPSAKAED